MISFAAKVEKNTERAREIHPQLVDILEVTEFDELLIDLRDSGVDTSALKSAFARVKAVIARQAVLCLALEELGEAAKAHNDGDVDGVNRELVDMCTVVQRELEGK